MKFQKVFGKNPAGKRLERIRQSRHYKNGSFQNVEKTAVMSEDASYVKMTREYFNKLKTVKPVAKLPSFKNDLKNIVAAAPSIVWFGHSSYFIKSKNFTLLVDPVFSGNASPVTFFGQSFPGSDIYSAEDFPDINVLIQTHDHYDHLDYKTITKLSDKVKQVVTPLGVGSHLEHWGMDSQKIIELDWGESHAIEDGIKLTATPSRHFSGRAFKRNQTLWASYVLELHGYKLFLGGDSGYDSQFKQIGDRYGPFDLALLESGQYGTDWPHIHMFPEETVQATLDLKAKVLMPVHWGKFVLANHAWDEPIGRIIVAAKNVNLAVVTPAIGEVITLGSPNQTNHWWNSIEKTTK